MKTNSGCLPRASSITDRATRFRTTNRSSRFLTRSPGMINTELFNSGTLHFPFPAQCAHFLFATSRVDLEQTHPGQMIRQGLKQPPLLFPVQRVRFARGRVRQQLNQRGVLEPGETTPKQAPPIAGQSSVILVS